MQKSCMCSAKLRHSFKMFRIKYRNEAEVDSIKATVMARMNEYLTGCDGYLVNYAGNS